jgi:hypothetical protein
MATRGHVIKRFGLEQCLLNSGVPKVVSMPVGAEIVGASLVRSAPVLWAVIDPAETNMQDRFFVMYVEEKPLDSSLHLEPNFTYVSAISLQNIFWHIIEVTE